MSPQSKKAYLEAIRTRYVKGKKTLKSKMLDEFCAVCGYHRKHAVRLLSQPIRRRKKSKKKLQHRGRKQKYKHEELQAPLTRIWLATNQICSKRLKIAIPLWIPHYEREYGQLTAEVKNLLLSMSPATIDRFLKPFKLTQKRKGISGTKPGTLLKNQIPIKTNNWDVGKPGYVESDTVAHCGNSLAGDFVWSITFTDIKTTWTENRAVWGKGAEGVLEQIKNIETKLPFKLLGFDCDNGSEFLNFHLLRYFTERPKEKLVEFTRSRPYKKNDNAYVEQKNWTHVRQLFGYDRFDKQMLVSLINDLYANEYNLWHNHFIPTMKLIEKHKVNSKYYKKYDEPKTPYQRLLETKHLSSEEENKLKQIHNELNPFELKKIVEKKLKIIFNNVKTNDNPRKKI
jgi:hypothetical protein